MAIDWLDCGAKAGGIVVALTPFAGWFRYHLIREMKSVVAKDAVQQKDYIEFVKKIEKELESIRKFESEFTTIALEVKQVKQGQDRLERTIKESTDEQSRQLTGAMESIRDRFDDMKDLIQASRGFNP